MAPCFVEHTNEVDISIGMIACMVRLFHHCNTLLLPQVRRNVQHRDRTRHGKHHFVPILCSGSNLASFLLGCTTVPDLELWTRL